MLINYISASRRLNNTEAFEMNSEIIIIIFFSLSLSLSLSFFIPRTYTIKPIKFIYSEI